MPSLVQSNNPQPRRSLQRARAAEARNPPEASNQNQGLTKKDLIDYFSSGCKSRDQFTIGTEHEKFVFHKGDLRPAEYSDIKSLLERMRDRFHWDPIESGGNLIGLHSHGQSISLEPGCQLELSGAQLKNIHETCSEVNSHLYQIKSIADEQGLAFLGLGFNPKWERDKFPQTPKERYDVMRQYMFKTGNLGIDMMYRTCTIQVNLDFESEEDMVNKLRVGLALQPIATALFANSPFKDGKLAGMHSYRSHVWFDTDKDRTGNLPFVFDEDFGFEKYSEWLLDVPMYLIERNGHVIDCTGESFREFMQGNLPQAPGELPTMEDWDTHVSCAFPDVRLKKFIEMRGADSGPFRTICALPALWVGLLYDKKALKEAVSLTSQWTQEDRDELRTVVPEKSLDAPFKGGTVNDVAKETLRIARGGLERRGCNEETFLELLEANAERGVSSAKSLVEQVEGAWDGDIDHAFTTMVY